MNEILNKEKQKDVLKITMIRRPIFSFVFFAYLISWTSWLIGYFLNDGGINMVFLIIGTFGPAIAGLILEKMNHSSELVLKILNIKFSLFSILLSVFIFPILFAVFIFYLVFFENYPTPDFSQISIINLIILIPVNVLLGGALGEEIGWRGYLLTNLKRKYSNVIASLIIGGIWALWHLPLFLTKAYTNQMLQYFIIVILISFIFTFLFNRSLKSIWPLVLLHASFNISNMVLGDLFPNTDGVLERDWYYFILLLFIVLAFGMSLSWLKRKHQNLNNGGQFLS